MEEPPEELSWDGFLEAFEDDDLALVYQGETGEGEQSRFSKLVSREGAEG